jgi:predicted TIM-barrel fold metal-dependent hydrolase
VKLDQVVSSDSHVNAPVEMWVEYLGPEFRDRAPMLERSDDGDFEVFEGRRKPLIGMTGAAGRRPQEFSMTVRRLDEVRAGGFEPGPRIEDQDRDGISAEVLFGGPPGPPLNSQDPAMARASFTAYNRWLADFCAYSPNRLYGIAYIPSDDPEDTLAEVRDAAALGMRGVLLTQRPSDGSWADERWDPLWHELVSLGWPAHFHVGGGVGALQHVAATASGAAGPLGYLNSMVARKLEMSLALGTFVLGGVLVKFPDLKLVSVEGQIGWVPFWKEYIDHVYEKHRWHLGYHLDEPPSFYIDRQVFYTFMEDRHGVDARQACGVDRIMWANDYPHSETTWPDSYKILAETFENVPEAEISRIVYGNCVELYGLR